MRSLGDRSLCFGGLEMASGGGGGGDEVVAHVCIACGTHLTPAQFAGGRMCCDAPAFGDDDVDEVLCNAAMRGDLAAVERALAAGATHVNAALREAACGGHLPIVERLLAAGATYVNVALREAACGGHLPIVERMLAAGAADVNYALETAAREGHLHVVERLLAVVEMVRPVAVTAAAENGYLPIVERWVAAGGIVTLVSPPDDVWPHAYIPFSTRAETDFFCALVGLADMTRAGQPARLNDALGYVFEQLARENRLVHSHTSTLETRKTHARGARYALRVCEALLARGATHATYDPDVMYAARAHDYGPADDE